MAKHTYSHRDDSAPVYRPVAVAAMTVQTTSYSDAYAAVVRVEKAHKVLSGIHMNAWVGNRALKDIKPHIDTLKAGMNSAVSHAVKLKYMAKVAISVSYDNAASYKKQTTVADLKVISEYESKELLLQAQKALKATQLFTTRSDIEAAKSLTKDFPTLHAHLINIELATHAIARASIDDPAPEAFYISGDDDLEEDALSRFSSSEGDDLSSEYAADDDLDGPVLGFLARPYAFARAESARAEFAEADADACAALDAASSRPVYRDGGDAFLAALYQAGYRSALAEEDSESSGEAYSPSFEAVADFSVEDHAIAYDAHSLTSTSSALYDVAYNPGSSVPTGTDDCEHRVEFMRAALYASYDRGGSSGHESSSTSDSDISPGSTLTDVDYPAFMGDATDLI